MISIRFYLEKIDKFMSQNNFCGIDKYPVDSLVLIIPLYVIHTCKCPYGSNSNTAERTGILTANYYIKVLSDGLLIVISSCML